MSPVRNDTFPLEKEGLPGCPDPRCLASPESQTPIQSTRTINTAEDSDITRSPAECVSGRADISTDSMNVGPHETSEIPMTVEGVLDISATGSSLYLDVEPEEGMEERISQQRSLITPTPPLVIDKRLTRVASHEAQPPRISFHQEGSLDDWTSSLFSAIEGGSSGDEGIAIHRNRETSIPEAGKEDGNIERGATPRPMSFVQLPASSPMSPAPALPEVSFGANISIGAHVRQARIPAPAQGGASASVAKGEMSREADESREPLSVSSPVLPDISFGVDVSALGKGLGVLIPPVPAPASDSISNSLLALAEGKAKPPATGARKVMDDISGEKPTMASLLQTKPLPLPIPISPSRIKSQLRPRKAGDSRSSSHSREQPLPTQSHLQPHPSANPSDSVSSPQSTSRRSSVSTSNPGDRDSGLSTVTVTPATIVMVRGKAVRRAVASVLDPDIVSLESMSKRDSVGSTCGVSRDTLDDDPQGDIDHKHHAEKSSQDVDRPLRLNNPETLVTSCCSSRPSSPSSTWPAPPPSPVRLDMDKTPRPPSRVRKPSLQRVSLIQGSSFAKGMGASPRSPHFSLIGSETASSSTCSSPLLTMPKGFPDPTALAKSKRIAPEATLLVSATDTFGGAPREDEAEVELQSVHTRSSTRKSVASSLRSASSSQSELRVPITSQQIPKAYHPSKTFAMLHPLLAPLYPFITPLDPSKRFTSLVEIAEGESGSVYAASVLRGSSVTAEPPLPGVTTDRPISPETFHVAIKRVLLPRSPPLESLAASSTSSTVAEESLVKMKLTSLLHELTLLKNIKHEHILPLDGVYVHTCPDVDDGNEDAGSGAVFGSQTSLWIRMELMERSLADVIALVADGLALQERMVARFASDVSVSVALLVS